MRSSWCARNVLGVAALAATLLLSGPGVRAVRADGPPVSVAPAGPVCSAEAPVARAVRQAELQRRLEELRSRAEGRESEAVVLNTRGYGYPALGGDGLEAIRRELMRVQRESEDGAH